MQDFFRIEKNMEEGNSEIGFEKFGEGGTHLSPTPTPSLQHPVPPHLKHKKSLI